MRTAYGSLGDARIKAQKFADRDNCDWIIDHDNEYSCYRIRDTFTSRDYSWEKPVETVSPSSKSKLSEEAILLTPAEKALVAAVIDPSEPGRDYFPGDEKVKSSLLSKLLRKK